MKTKEVLFIINPHSGTNRNSGIEKRILKFMKDANIETRILITEYAGHAKEMVGLELLKEEKPSAIIAVGGDGTVNEVVSGIGTSGIPMGIIPTGSGNGLVRHLKIPLNPTKALQNIFDFNVYPIDLMKIGKKNYGINVTGVGFDALVSWRFSESKTRGLASYIRIILEEFLHKKPQTYQIEVDGVHFEFEAQMITIANSTQFGNNAIIAPGASVNDGLLDICILKPFPITASLDIASKIMTGKIDRSKFYERVKGKEIVIHQKKAEYQIDGDFIKRKKKLKVMVLPLAMNMIIPEGQNEKI